MNISPEMVELALRGEGLSSVSREMCEQLASYASLLMRWNARLNLTSIRDEDVVLRRHVVEGVFVAHAIPVGARKVLDFGSGTGIPGIPTAICRPDLTVTLAESNQKKAAFLREVARVVPVSVVVYAGRVEKMAPGSLFEVVMMRAVDRMRAMIEVAIARLAVGGLLMISTTAALERHIRDDYGSVLRLDVIQHTRGTEKVLLTGAKRS